MKNRKEIKVYLDEELLKWLKRDAARRRCSVAQVVRDLIVVEIERREQKSEK